ncbi:hypothetical protein GCM10027287_08510 [Bordetella muralis]
MIAIVIASLILAFARLDGATMFAVDLPFSVGGAALNAVPAAVVADTTVIYVVDHDLAVIDVRDAMHVDMVDLAVVVKAIALPIAAVVSRADIAKAIIDAAVIAYLAAPVTRMPAIEVADETPITRRPECADERRHDPGARHPVIPAMINRPIAGRPDIAWAGNHRLIVDGQRWWRRVPCVDADADRDIGRRGR